jgi:hypothetical protein
VRRSLWMTVLAALVVAVAGASAASAEAEPLFEADSYAATVSGTPLEKTVFGFRFSVAPFEWECVNAQVQGELPGAVSSLVLVPTDAECRWQYPPGSPFTVVTMAMNGCKWKLHGLSKVETGAYKSLVDLECPAGQEVSIELRELTVTICRLRVPSQASKSQVFLLDKSNKEKEPADDSIEMSLAVEKLHYKLEALSLGCPVAGGTYEDMTYKGKESLTAKTKSGGVQTGLRLSG